MKKLRSFILILILILPGLSSFGAEQCAYVLSEAFSEAVSVAESVQKNKFVTDRDLIDYQNDLHPDFQKSLASLGSEHHWIDLGAGKANAQIQFLKIFRNPRRAPLATAVAYKLDRWFSPPKFDGKLQIKEGAFEKQPTHGWPKADLITDFFGVLSYTKYFSRALNQTLDLLKVNGELYIVTTP